jgi:hypothetical protein
MKKTSPASPGFIQPTELRLRERQAPQLFLLRLGDERCESEGRGAAWRDVGWRAPRRRRPFSLRAAVGAALLALSVAASLYLAVRRG